MKRRSKIQLLYYILVAGSFLLIVGLILAAVGL